MARRDDREYREYLSEEQRSQPAWSGDASPVECSQTSPRAVKGTAVTVVRVDRLRVARVSLFGSFARMKADQDSDVDLA